MRFSGKCTEKMMKFELNSILQIPNDESRSISEYQYGRKTDVGHIALHYFAHYEAKREFEGG